MKNCNHDKGTIYTPKTGITCNGCNEKLVQVWVTEKEEKLIKSDKFRQLKNYN